MDLDFTGKVAFVTGGSKGIGKSIVETLVACGANVGVMARGKKSSARSSASLPRRGAGRPSHWRGMSRAFGGLRLAVNNAGIAGRAGLLHETGPQNWRHIMGINLDVVGYAMMVELEEMLKAGGGSIVNIASVEAHTILKQNPFHTASKHALLGLTKARRRIARSTVSGSTPSPLA